MHGMWRLPSVQGFHDEDPPHERVLDDPSAAGKEPEHSPASSTHIVIYLYNKTKDHVAPGFRCAGCIVIAAIFIEKHTHCDALAAMCGRMYVLCSMKFAC